MEDWHLNSLKIAIVIPTTRNSYKQCKLYTYRFLETNEIRSKLAQRFHFFMITLIIVNIIAVMLETVPDIEIQYGLVLQNLELFSVVMFSIEYILRLWSCNLNSRYRGHIWGRFRFMLTPMALIDLLSIIPFYLPMIITFDLRILRLLRLFRIFRLFKIGRYSDAYRLIMRVIEQKLEYIGVSLIFVLSLLIIASSLMYFIEHDTQPDAFSSIPATMWWAIVTLTTVGYGDIYPVTTMGKILSGFIALLGIGVFALPAGILASGFSDEIHKKYTCPELCPHCGNEIK